MNDFSSQLKALADPVRLAILDFLLNPVLTCCVREEGVCACDFETVLGMSQPAVSHHMKLLVQAGFVGAEKRGRWVYYELNPSAFAASADVTERAVQAWLAKPKIDPEVKAYVEERLGINVPDPAKPELEPFLKQLRQTRPELFQRLKSNRTKCLSYGIVYGGRAYISLQGAERYLNERKLPRVTRRPKDSLTVEAATAILPYSRWKIYKAVFAGEIEAVVHSQTIYLDRKSVERYRLEQKSLLPLPGWILMQDAAQQVGRSYASLKAWLTFEPISKMPQENNDAGELDKSAIVSSVVLVTNG